MYEFLSFLLTLISFSLTIYLERKRLANEFRKLPVKAVGKVILFSIVIFFLWHFEFRYVFSNMNEIDSFIHVVLLFYLAFAYVFWVLSISYAFMTLFKWPCGTLTVLIFVTPVLLSLDHHYGQMENVQIIGAISFVAAVIGLGLDKKWKEGLEYDEH